MNHTYQFMIYAYIHNTCVQESYLFRKKPDLLQILRSARFAREERKRQDWNNNKIIILSSCLPNWQICIFLRLIKEQQRQVSKVLLDGLYDPESNLFILLGAHHLVMQSVWKELKKSWQLFPNANDGHVLTIGETYAPTKGTKWSPSGSVPM